MILVDTSVWIDYFNGRDTPQTGKFLRFEVGGIKALSLSAHTFTQASSSVLNFLDATMQ